MWDLQLANPLGRLSMRKLLSFVAALVVTVFGYILLNPSSAFAADANWKDQYIQYEGRSFVAQSAAGQNDSRQIPAGDKVYMQVDTPTPTGTGGALSQKAYTINFAANTDLTKEFSATYTEYSFVPPDTFTNPSNRKTITVEAQAAQNGDKASGCAIEGGLSWIICPLTTTLANGMDWVFGVLRSFLEVKPLQSNQQNTLYKTWDYMRAFANVAFIIGFLIIIYSQVTSTGISNYGVKKLLPRLIIAAILVNVSYYMCSIAVDLSNILGQSIQSLFISVRNALSGATNDSWDVTSWSSVTGFILSGGAVIGAGAISFKLAAVALSGAASGAIYLILPALLAGLLAVLLVIVVLATRQALIIILIILSPLAMVAYLLPNTEKWFEKWRDLLMTMLIMFPAFSLIFGGSQLAGELIIQNSTSIVMLILGLAVQVAPLFITPILFKLSGSLLGRIAGMINNPNKGLVDRTKNWANDRLAEKNALEMRKNHQMAKDGTLKRRNAFRRSALNSDVRKRNREGLKSINETTASALFAGSEDGLKLHEAEHTAHQLKERIENEAKTHLQQKINMTGSKLNIDNVKLEASKIELEAKTTETAALMDELKSGRAVMPAGELSAVMSTMRSSAEMVALNGMRNESAKRAWNEDFTKKLENNQTTIAGDGRLLQDYAGGVQGVEGAQRALASAISAQSKAHGESVSNATTILNHGNYTDDIVGEIALGNTAGTNIIVTDDMREAAIVKIAGGANTNEILKLMQNIEINPSKENQDFRQAFADTLIANGNKPKFAGAGIIAEIKKGNAPAPGKARIDKFVSDTINADKMGSADLLVTHDKEYLSSVLATLQNNTSGVTLDPQALARIKSEIDKAKTNPLYSGKIGERATVLDEIDKLI